MSYFLSWPLLRKLLVNDKSPVLLLLWGYFHQIQTFPLYPLWNFVLCKYFFENDFQTQRWSLMYWSFVCLFVFLFFFCYLVRNVLQKAKISAKKQLSNSSWFLSWNRSLFHGVSLGFAELSEVNQYQSRAEKHDLKPSKGLHTTGGWI